MKQTMNNSIKNVDDYLSGLPENVLVALEKLRKIARAAAPGAEEVISYGMPMLKYHGMLVGYAGWKDHIGFYPCNSRTIAAMKDELKGYGTSKGTIRFEIGKPLPVKLIQKIVKERVKENVAKAKKTKK